MTHVHVRTATRFTRPPVISLATHRASLEPLIYELFMESRRIPNSSTTRASFCEKPAGGCSGDSASSKTTAPRLTPGTRYTSWLNTLKGFAKPMRGRFSRAWKKRICLDKRVATCNSKYNKVSVTKNSISITGEQALLAARRVRQYSVLTCAKRQAGNSAIFRSLRC
jgi:hypothetical protein